MTKLSFSRLVITPEDYSGTVRVSSEIDAGSWYPDGYEQHNIIEQVIDGGVFSVSVKSREEGHIISQAASTSVFSAEESVAVRRSDESTGRLIAEELSFDVREGEDCTVEKLVAVCDSVRSTEPLKDATTILQSLPRYAALEEEQKAAWSRYWSESDILIEGDDFAQAAVRFFVFHLLQSYNRANSDMKLDVSIPAKLLSDPGYSGHIFWNTEVYLLPFYSLQYPEVAEQLLKYRLNRIGQARTNAEAEGMKGARFPWERLRV